MTSIHDIWRTSCRRWLIQDTLKVLTYKLLYTFDIFQIKSSSFAGKAGHVPGTEHLLGIQVRQRAHEQLVINIGYLLGKLSYANPTSPAQASARLCMLW